MAESDTSRRRARNKGANGASAPGAIQSDDLEAGTDPARPSSRRSAWPSGRRQETPVNSIGVAPSRDRPVLDKAAAPEDARSRPEARPETHRAEAEAVVPGHIRDRYIQVRRRFHFPDGDPAFHVQATRTTTRSESPQVIRDILEIERARAAGSALRVRGSAEFRAEAWMQAQLMGVEVRGYRPSDLERAKLARTIGQEQRRAQDVTNGHTPEGPTPDKPTERPSVAASRVPERERGTPNEGRTYRGRLRDHGAANFEHNRHEAMSYYVSLDTPTGERILWGKDFERAIKQSLSTVKVGDEVSVQQVGERPVTVTRRRLDDQGNFVRGEEVAAYRNRWIVEKQEFLREREEVARVVRDPTMGAEEAVKAHPTLAGTYVELQAAKLAAKDLYSHEDDRKRFVQRIRDALADEIARGESVSVPRLKNPDARESTGDGTRTRKPREPRAQALEHVRV